MSKDYMSTNLLMQALLVNFDSYPQGSKNIDMFTLLQIENLLEKMQEFITESILVDFDGDETTRDMIMLCFHQQPNSVRCRFCTASFEDYEKAVAHMKDHDRQVAELHQMATKASFIEEKCIPRQHKGLPKITKKFLRKDTTSMLKRMAIDSNDLQIDSSNIEVLQQLEELLKPSYPLVKCHPFGSRIAGTGHCNSDLDIFVDLENVYHGRKDKQNGEEIIDSIKKVCILLREKRTGWLFDAMITNARVPLLRVFNEKYDLKCDLTFTNGLAHRNSELLKYMFDLQPTGRLLVCYLKKWNRESSLNAYTLSLMVIFFFQCRNLLPPVALLQADPDCDIIIDGWNAGFTKLSLQDLGLKLCQETVQDLSKQFFEFYSYNNKTFSLETQVVCPFVGHVGVYKRIFSGSSFDDIPPKMDRLRRYMIEHKKDPISRNLFACNKPIVVQDPFELRHNVAKGISVEVASRLLRSFQLSATFDDK